MDEHPNPADMQIPDRLWAEKSVRPYLLGELTGTEEEVFCDALFVHSGLNDRLENQESELIEHFLDRKLELDPQKNAALIRRWAAPEGHAKLELARLERAMQARSAELDRTNRPAQTPIDITRRRSPALLLKAGLAASVALLAVLGYEAAGLKKQNAELAKNEEVLKDLQGKYRSLQAANEDLIRRHERDAALPPQPRGTSAPKEPPEIRLAGATQVLKAHLSGGVVEIDSQKILFWDVDIASVELYEAMVKTSGSTVPASRSLLITHGRVEIPFRPEEVPFVLSIRNRKTGSVPVSNVTIAKER